MICQICHRSAARRSVQRTAAHPVWTGGDFTIFCTVLIIADGDLRGKGKTAPILCHPCAILRKNHKYEPAFAKKAYTGKRKLPELWYPMVKGGAYDARMGTDTGDHRIY